MSRLRIRERVKRKAQAFAWLQLRCAYMFGSHMWLWANIGLMHTLGRLEMEDVATELPLRDIFNFLSPQDCINFMRFSREQIVIMLDLLGVPDIIRTECGYLVSGRTALCVLLYRLSFPCRLKDMRLVFHLADSCICEVFNWMLHFMNESWGSLLRLDMERLVPKLEYFAAALVQWGCPLEKCWGFIDGTVRGIARPKRQQRIFYNGHKRKHAMKFQGIVTPDGICVDLYGPEHGSRHDLHLLNESGVLASLVANMNSQDGEPYTLYGDPAYGQSTHLCCPFSVESFGPLTEPMKDFNYHMSACRITVEWLFKEMSGQWAFVNLKPQQKYLLSPVAVQYKVATLLSNFHSCLNGGNEISQFFHCPPPTLQEYLGVE